MTQDIVELAWKDLDQIVGRYYRESLNDQRFRYTVAKLMPHMIQIIDWYGDHKDYVDFKTYLIMTGVIITNYVEVLGAAKNLCLERDGAISSHIRSHDALLELLYEFDEQYSLELMMQYPKAYVGIKGEWVNPAKFCL
ncbi:MAG: hypothetical protein M0R77_10520 [Gammaproteobacteria bacterium]|nr:hypothetical protein [Gammaproteobacteria bacterium]